MFFKQTNKKIHSFLPHSDSIESHWKYTVLWFWHKLNFDFCVPRLTIEHISEEGWTNGNIYWRVYYAPSFSDIYTPISSMLFLKIPAKTFMSHISAWVLTSVEVRSTVQRGGCTLLRRLLLTNFTLQYIGIIDNAWQFGHCGILPLKWRNWKVWNKYCSPQVRTTAFKHQWKSIISLRKGQKYHKWKVH